jgi:hypothetical protein
MYTCREGEEEEEEEDLLIFNDTIDGPRVPAAKPGGGGGAFCLPAPPRFLPPRSPASSVLVILPVRHSPS